MGLKNVQTSQKKGYDAEAVSFRFVSDKAAAKRVSMGKGDVTSESKNFGKYLLLRELGHGGMGTVYLAEDTSLGRIVALKVLLPGLSADESFINRFREEARSVATVSHPNIVRVHSLDFIDNQYVIDMEYLDGGSLSDLLQQEVMSPQRALQVLAGVIHALAACHQCGIIHRDVKPHNVLVEAQGRVVLTDFGISTAYADHITKAMRRSASCSFFVGTPRYAPPEAWDHTAATPAWDIYSLAMMIHECVTGRVLYDGATPLEIARKMFLEEPPELGEGFVQGSPEFSQLLREMLSLEAKKRPQDGVALLERLQLVPEWLELGPLTDDTVAFNASEALRRVKRRQGWTRYRALARNAGLYVVGVVTLLALGISVWSQRELVRSIWAAGSGGMEQVATAPESSATIFQGVSLADASTPHAETAWYIRERGVPEEREGVVFSANGLWGIEVFGAPGTDLRVQGFAAEYRSGGGHGYREAQIAGTGRPMSPNTYAFSLEFTCTTTRERWDWTGTLSAHAELTNEATFRAALQAADAPQALLFRELLPRRRPWARDVLEGIYPTGQLAFETPILESPFQTLSLSDTEALLNRPIYTNSGRVRPIASLSGPGGSRMYTYSSGERLLVAVDCPVESDAPFYLQVAIAPVLAYPVRSTPLYVASLGPDGFQNAHVVQSGIEQPWRAHWEGESRQENGRFLAYLSIPAEGMRGASLPIAGNGWFLGAALSPTAQNGQAYARWGSSSLESLNGALLLRFTDAVPSPGGDDEN